MTNKDLFGVLVRWTGLILAAVGFASGSGILGGLGYVAVGAAMYLFADAIVDFAYRPNPLAIFNHFRPGPHTPPEPAPHETQAWK